MGLQSHAEPSPGPQLLAKPLDEAHQSGNAHPPVLGLFSTVVSPMSFPVAVLFPETSKREPAAWAAHVHRSLFCPRAGPPGSVAPRPAKDMRLLSTPQPGWEGPCTPHPSVSPQASGGPNTLRHLPPPQEERAQVDHRPARPADPQAREQEGRSVGSHPRCTSVLSRAPRVVASDPQLPQQMPVHRTFPVGFHRLLSTSEHSLLTLGSCPTASQCSEHRTKCHHSTNCCRLLLSVCTSLSRRRLARTPGHTRLWARVYSGALSLQPALSTQVAISGATMGAHTHLSPSSSGHHSQPQRHGHLESREPQGSLSQENHSKHQQHGAGRNLGCHSLYPIQPLPPQPCPPSPSHPPPGAALPWLPLSPSSRLRLREVLYCHFSCLWGRRRIACCVPCVPPAPYFCLRVFALAVPFPDPGAAGSSETSPTTQNMLPHHLPRRLPFFVKSFYSSVHLPVSATLH